MTSRPICAIDTETTGLHWEREAWEIALIRRDTGGVTELSFFLPLSVKSAEAKALDIGGYYSRHPYGKWVTDQSVDESDHRGISAATAPEPDGDTYLWPEHAARVIQRMTHGATLVGAQPQFDSYILERLLRRAELTPSWHYRLRDVESMTAGYLAYDPGGLADCRTALDLRGPWDAHTALGDAQVALQIYDILITETAERLRIPLLVALVPTDGPCGCGNPHCDGRQPAIVVRVVENAIHPLVAAALLTQIVQGLRVAADLNKSVN